MICTRFSGYSNASRCSSSALHGEAFVCYLLLRLSSKCSSPLCHQTRYGSSRASTSFLRLGEGFFTARPQQTTSSRCCKAHRSSSGFSRVTMKSALLPGAIEPVTSPMPASCTLRRVAVWKLRVSLLLKKTLHFETKRIYLYWRNLFDRQEISYDFERKEICGSVTGFYMRVYDIFSPDCICSRGQFAA